MLLIPFGLRGLINELLETIPAEDRKTLEQFFQFLFLDNEFSYTLFGEKPITVTIITAQPRLECAIEHLISEKGWEVWTRYQHLFPSSRFIVKRDIFGENLAITISLINKAFVYQKISENLPIFQKFLGTVSPDEVFDLVCNGDRSIFDLASPFPQAIIGILLGYGAGNALNFQREFEIFEGLNRQLPPLALSKTMDELSSFEQKILKGYGQKKYRLRTKAPPLVMIFHDLKEILRKRRGFQIGNFDLDRCCSPGFACWEGSETEELKKSYQKTRSILRNKFKNGSLLEDVLKQWISPNETD